MPNVIPRPRPKKWLTDRRRRTVEKKIENSGVQKTLNREPRKGPATNFLGGILGVPSEHVLGRFNEIRKYIKDIYLGNENFFNEQGSLSCLQDFATCTKKLLVNGQVTIVFTVKSHKSHITAVAIFM